MKDNRSGFDYARAAIVCKYLGPTNYRGSRVKATCQAGSLTISWDYSLNSEQVYRKAMQALADKLGWNYSQWAGGVIPSGEYVYVMVDTE